MEELSPPFPQLTLLRFCRLPENGEHQLAMSPTGDRIAVLPYRAKEGSGVQIYQARDMSHQKSFGGGYGEGPNKLWKPCSAVWMPQNELVVASKDPTRLSVWSVESGTHLRDISLAASGITSLNAMEKSPKANKLFIAGYHKEDREWGKGSLFTLDLQSETFTRSHEGKMFQVSQLCLRRVANTPFSMFVPLTMHVLHCMMSMSHCLVSLSMLEANVSEGQVFQVVPVPEGLKGCDVTSLSADESGRCLFLSGSKGAILPITDSGATDSMNTRPIISNDEELKDLTIDKLVYADGKLTCLCFEDLQRSKGQLRIYNVDFDTMEGNDDSSPATGPETLKRKQFSSNTEEDKEDTNVPAASASSKRMQPSSTTEEDKDAKIPAASVSTAEEDTKMSAAPASSV